MVFEVVNVVSVVANPLPLVSVVVNVVSAQHEVLLHRIDVVVTSVECHNNDWNWGMPV